METGGLAVRELVLLVIMFFIAVEALRCSVSVHTATTAANFVA